jgi:ESCRT-II complex subunit VPS25
MATPTYAAVTFSPPKIWQTFPPFFTLQPTDSTRATQLEEWGKLLLAHCSSARVSTLPAYKSWPLWENAALHRSLPEEGRAAVAAHLITTRRAAWLDDTRVGLRVYWKSVEEWAALVVQEAREHAFEGSTTTFLELTEPARHNYAWAVEPERLRGLEPAVLKDALQLLAREGVVAIFEDPEGGSNFGVQWTKIS